MATVLIVDDQGETGDLLTRVIRHLGHHGVHVPSGEDALSYVREHGTDPPDAVLLDYMMPGMDGLEVLRALRDDPQMRDVPVIMFSANSDPRVLEKAMRAGANDYWIKATLPIDEFQMRLLRWLPAN
ncbi:MAG TPA: response regulator [Tepidisphaeraceae bacterium]|jgi:CheY-like chemotaxis protein